MNGTSSSSASSRSSSSAKSTPRPRRRGGRGVGSGVLVLVLGDQRSARRRLRPARAPRRPRLRTRPRLRRRPAWRFTSSASSSGSGRARARTRRLRSASSGSNSVPHLGQMRRAAAQVVELARTGGANLLCAQFGIGQGGASCESRVMRRAAPLPRRAAAVKSQSSFACTRDQRGGQLHGAEAGLTARPAVALRGRVRAPGDKSISHRALILGALARGRDHDRGPAGRRRRAAHRARRWRAFGADGERDAARAAGASRGHGGFAEPADVDRLRQFRHRRAADHGRGGRLRTQRRPSPATPRCAARPMMRVLRPLGEMGASWLCREGGRLPLALKGGGLAGDRLPPAGAVGAGEVGGAAGRPERRRASPR